MDNYEIFWDNSDLWDYYINYGLVSRSWSMVGLGNHNCWDTIVICCDTFHSFLPFVMVFNLCNWLLLKDFVTVQWSFFELPELDCRSKTEKTKNPWRQLASGGWWKGCWDKIIQKPTLVGGFNHYKHRNIYIYIYYYI